MMDELAALDTIDDLLMALPEDHDCHPQRLHDEGFRLTGVLIVGQYVAPDGRSTGMVPVGIGAMNAWTQEGIHRWALRRMAAGEYGIDDDDSEDDS